MRTTPRAAPFFLAAAAATAPAGCAAAEEPRTLEGTSWQLVSIQSTAVPDATKFSVEFAADGKAHFQLNCNRGNGSYQYEPSADGTSGELTFGPVATTMMMCPEPSLDQQVSQSLEDVRTYRFTDDRLHLSLTDDGGVLSWQPA